MNQSTDKDKVLLATDEPATLKVATEILQLEGYKVLGCTSLKWACGLLDAADPEIAVVDYHLGDSTAVQFLEAAKRANPEMQCLVLAELEQRNSVVGATRDLAEQVVSKPVDAGVFRSAVRACREGLHSRRRELARQVSTSRYERDPFEGISTAIQRLKQEALRVVTTGRPILIQGETGAGKGVLADWFHKNGPRAEEAFVDLNCAGLSKDLLESELFGYEKGAFTGASGSKPGLVEVAHRGILFLDEVGEMDPLVQPKLLNVLEGRSYRRLGDVRERNADIQIIAATNRNPMQLVRDGRFREDLYYRINTFHVTIPPLRERVEDILIIAGTLLKRLARDLAREAPSLSLSAESALKRYSWPGNIRELRNVLERIALTCASPVLEEKDLALEHSVVEERSSLPYDTPVLTLAEMERRHIARALFEESGRVPQAARLGIPRSTLYQKIKTYGISTQSH